MSGIFEADPRRGGFLRFLSDNLERRPGDPVVPDALVQEFALRGGEEIAAQVASGQRGGSVVTSIDSICGKPPQEHRHVESFDKGTAIDPERQLRFETPGGSPSMRVVDLMTPIGLGQRGLIVAAPRTGKTMLLEQMAEGVATNYPDAHLMVALIDERPEEVTAMRRGVRGEVISSSNDADTESHIRIARLIIERAKRLVEHGRDVVMLLDSLTRLGRAFNSGTRGGGRTMSGGLDIKALNEPKSIFGAARNVEHGGSLTIIATALVETGSRMDDVIFNEFKGTGNMEIMLARELADRRLWPAIDLNQSGTRKEERLLDAATLQASHRIRRTLLDRGSVRAMESLLEVLQKTSSNDEFVRAMEPVSIGRRRL